MSYFKRINITTFLLIVCLFLGAFLRLWQLGNIPHGLSNDEAGYIYSSYSLWKTGHDLAGKFLPLSINLDNSFSPVYIYADAPFVGIFGLNSLMGRLPYALAGIASIAVIYFLAYELVGSEIIAVLSALLLAISPWHLQLTRGALDADFALLFLLLGILFFIRGIKKGNILWSLIFFLLGFYSYHATKIFAIFAIPVVFWIYRKDLLKRKKEAALFITGFIVIIISFVYVSATQQVTRQEVLLWNDPQTAAQVVDRERLYNSAPPILKEIYSNKALYYLRIIRENYLQAFSMQHLFLFGEPSGLKRQYSLLTRGEMYFLDLPFLLLGIYYLCAVRKKSLPLLLLLIAPIPSALTSEEPSYVNRSIMMLPFLLIFTAAGMYFFWQLLKPYPIFVKRICISIVLLLYVFLFSSYLYQYYYRYDIESAEGWARSERDLAEFIGSTHQKYQNVYVEHAGEMFLLQYGIFSKIAPTVIQEAWKHPTTAQIDNVHFIDHCTDKSFANNDVHSVFKPSSLVAVPDDCYKTATPSARIKEKGDLLRTIWKIYKL